MDKIDKTILSSAVNYEAYHLLMADLVTHQKTKEYTEEQINYTRMNIVRMERLDKTTRLLPAVQDFFKELKTPLFFLILTEPWCGDAAQVLPVVQKLASQNDLLEVGMIMRDQNLEIMDQFLTEGARSIPKIIVLNSSDNQVLGAWGPRPFIAQAMIQRGMNQWREMEEGTARDLFKRDLLTQLQKWYARDKTTSIQEEFSAFLESLLK